MDDWRRQLRFDPLPALVSSTNKAIVYFAQHDLLDQWKVPREYLWELPSARKMIERQQKDGSWKYPGGKPSIRSSENYNQLETYRVLGELIEKYGFTREHPSIGKAADFMFEFQTDDGDLRGIYGNQFSPNYTAAIMELLIKAGYESDSRIEKGFPWLLSVRQEDGGWAIPVRTVGGRESRCISQALNSPITFQPDRSKPFSHCITGVVLRAFAAHPRYREKEEAKNAGRLLKSRFFKADKYPDRKAASFWTSFSYPFWFTDLLSALDSLSLLGFPNRNEEVRTGLQWFIDRQQDDGLWNLHLLRGKDKELPLWIGLAICRVFRRFHT